MASRAATGAPLVPKKTRPDSNRVTADVKAAFHTLNADFGLDLEFPGSWAYNDLQHQCFNGDLAGTLDDFRAIVRQHFFDWVRKPRADRDTLPSSSRSYRARNDEERAQLRELLRVFLRERRPQPPRQRNRVLTKSYSEGDVRAGKDAPLSRLAPLETPAPQTTVAREPAARRPSKRPSGEGLEDDPCKRPRPLQTSLREASSALDTVPVRSTINKQTSVASLSASGRNLAAVDRIPGQPGLKQGRTSPAKASSSVSVPRLPPPAATASHSFARSASPLKQNSFCLNESASTSRVSLVSDVFSVVHHDDDDYAFNNTQTTVEASTQELERLSQKLARHAHQHSEGKKLHQQQPKQQQQQQVQPPPIVRSTSRNTAQDTTGLVDQDGDTDMDELLALREAECPTTPVRKVSRGDGGQRRSARKQSPQVSQGEIFSSFSGILDMETPKQSGPGPAWLPVPASRSEPPTPQKRAISFEDRLEHVWPELPSWLQPAPLAVAWEVTRIALYCGVDLSAMKGMKYDSSWTEHKAIWAMLYQRPEFRGKRLPERSDEKAWNASLNNGFQSKGQVVILSASMDFASHADANADPFFTLSLKKLKLENESHRLSRRFGSDRFLELFFPNPTSSRAPAVLRDDENLEALNRWLSCRRHSLAGRKWASFFTKDAGYKKPIADVLLGQEVKPIFKDKVYLFAEDGEHFRPPATPSMVPPRDETVDERTVFKVHDMLDWLVDIKKNGDQPYLKLFSRFQLGLSKTTPTKLFEMHQIRHLQRDIISPAGNVMNDGIAMMSLSVAKHICLALGLDHVPCAIQGRLGSAKGMWIVDVNDCGEEDWIETRPSQRKWKCDFLDPAQRTLEVLDHPKPPISATLNLQFVLVLQDRSLDGTTLRRDIGQVLERNLVTDLKSMREAMEYPIQFRDWVERTSSLRPDRVANGTVPYLAGLPESDSETMLLMLLSGFDKSQKYLQDLMFRLKKQKCEHLKKKLNVVIPRSAYLYMVVDFWGVLEEGEVHVAFSSGFSVDTGDGCTTSDTMLDGVDVLVSRSPSHLPSDVQKVRAVFHPKLKRLQNVIVFSAKGNTPLADKLAGGDYDGDKALVVWEPALVNNFESAEVPEQPDLFAEGYLRKVKDTMQDLLDDHHHCGDLAAATADLIAHSFRFNMAQNYLGICTNFKEKLCYERRTVSDRVAIRLSTLVSHLVDQSKQGIVFTAADWLRFRRDLLGNGSVPDPKDPAYKLENWGGSDEPDHIIDHLKFRVAKPLIDEELGEFHRGMSSRSSRNPTRAPSPTKRVGGESGAGAGAGAAVATTMTVAHYFDSDLVKPYGDFKGDNSRSSSLMLESLERSIREVEALWKTAMRPRGACNATGGSGTSFASATDNIEDASYVQKVQAVFEKWLAVQPDVSQHRSLPCSKTVRRLQPDFVNEALTPWRQLQASTAYKLFYRTNPRFVWRMAGYQLCHIKAQAVSARSPGFPAMVVSEMYAMTQSDSKAVRQRIARLEGTESLYTGGGGDYDDHGEDEDDEEETDYGLDDDDDDWYNDLIDGREKGGQRRR